MKLLLSKTDPKLGVMIAEARDQLHRAQGDSFYGGGKQWKAREDAHAAYYAICQEIGRLVVSFAVVDEYDARQSTIQEFINAPKANELSKK